VVVVVVDVVVVVYDAFVESTSCSASVVTADACFNVVAGGGISVAVCVLVLPDAVWLLQLLLQLIVP